MSFGLSLFRQKRRTGRLFFNVTLFVVLMTIIYFVCLFSAGGHLRLVAVENIHVKWEQKRRNATLEAACKNTHGGSSLGERELEYTFQHIIVDDEHRLLYCYIPKVACSNWKRVFQVLYGEYQNVEEILKLDHNKLKLLSDYPPNEIEHKLHSYFKFLFVREPVDRLRSAYENKFHHDVDFQRQYGRQIVFKYRKDPPKDSLGDDVTLEEFLQYFVDQPMELMNEHWRSYESLCQPCHIKYNFIGKFEHLMFEAPYLLETLGLQNKVHFPKQQRYYQNSREEMHQPEHQQDSKLPPVWNGVVKKLRHDFELFHYPVPLVEDS